MNFIFSIIFIFGLITLFFLSPACMCVGLIRLSNEDYGIESSEFVKSCIPIYNYFYGWNSYNGNWLSLAGIGNILLVISVISRLVVMFFFFYNETLQMYTVYFFLASVLIFWILNAITIYSVLTDSGIYDFKSKLLHSVSVITGQIVIGYYLPRNLKYYSNKKEKRDLYGRGKK